MGTDDRLQRHRSLLSDKNAYPDGMGLVQEQSLFRREEPARVTRLTTYVEFMPDGRERADKRLRAFLQEMKKSR